LDLNIEPRKSPIPIKTVDLDANVMRVCVSISRLKLKTTTLYYRNNTDMEICIVDMQRSTSNQAFSTRNYSIFAGQGYEDLAQRMQDTQVKLLVVKTMLI
jgi:hypothetical protein